ncbi:MAG: glycosyltransferase [Saprospiraceae bacterium]|nr:glycosyltransferase [Pyrinomonadaceae bacterium]
MKIKVLYVERKPHEFVSLEKAFRQIAACISERFETDFQQLPYGLRFPDTIKNLIFFRKRKADIYHITGHVHYIALLFSPRNTVLSIMDLRFLYIKNGLRRFLLKKLYLDLPVKRLEYITAISEQTKQEIIFHTKCREDKIRMLDLTLFNHFYVENERPFNAEKPVILQVGTMENKNVPNLIRALRGLSCKLVIIGKVDALLLTVLRENEIDFESRSELNGDEMRSEYERSDIVAFCSTLEGFGLPIIEAQSMQKPVVTSNISPMIETSGSAAALVDPLDVASIRAGIDKVIGDREFRNKLIMEGLQNIERFNPRITAAGYEKLYEEILVNIEAGKNTN